MASGRGSSPCSARLWVTRGTANIELIRLPPTEATIVASTRLAPHGPSKALPRATSGRVCVASSGTKRRHSHCRAAHSRPHSSRAPSKARGMSRAGSRASPPGINPDSKPTKAYTISSSAGPRARPSAGSRATVTGAAGICARPSATSASRGSSLATVSAPSERIAQATPTMFSAAIPPTIAAKATIRAGLRQAQAGNARSPRASGSGSPRRR